MHKNSGIYYGLINGLLTLIPVFPTWSIIPGVFLAGIAERVIMVSCPRSMLITATVAAIALVTDVMLYFRNINQYESRNKADYKSHFRFFCFRQYIFGNTGLFIGIIGPDTLCKSDGQTILGVMLSGLFASIWLVILGVLFDQLFKKELTR
jgi:hypothetical protein